MRGEQRQDGRVVEVPLQGDVLVVALHDVACDRVGELLQPGVGGVPFTRLVVALVEALELGVGEVRALVLEPSETLVGVARQDEDPPVALGPHGAGADAGGAELVEEGCELGGQERALASGQVREAAAPVMSTLTDTELDAIVSRMMPGAT